MNPTSRFFPFFLLNVHIVFERRLGKKEVNPSVELRTDAKGLLFLRLTCALIYIQQRRECRRANLSDLEHERRVNNDNDSSGAPGFLERSQMACVDF